MLLDRGAKPSADPRSPGEMVVALFDAQRDPAVRGRIDDAFWIRALEHAMPYVQETALETAKTNQPFPKPVLARLPKLLGASDPDVLHVACQIAAATKDKALRAPVLAAVAKVGDHQGLYAAFDAAEAVGARQAAYVAIAHRLAEKDRFAMMFGFLVRVVDAGGYSMSSNLSSDEIAKLVKTWDRFLAAHRAEIDAGTRFPPRDRRLDLALFPKDFHFSLHDGSQWP
jgi:hypothetical protein